MNLVILVIFRNLLILVNLVISGIFIDSCQSDGFGDSGAYGHSCDSIESVYSCKSGASSESDKNGYSVDSVGSDQFGCYVKFCDSGKYGDSGESGDYEKTDMSGKSGNSCESSDNGDFGD